LDRPTVFAKSLRRGSASTILASVFLVATAFAQVALSQGNVPSQGSDDAMVRRVVEYYMRIGTEQYDRGYYADAEKTFEMAQGFADRLDPAQRAKLQSLQEKASQAVAERKKVLEVRQSAQDLLR